MQQTWRLLLMTIGAALNTCTYGFGVWGESTLLTGPAFVGAQSASLVDSYILFATIGLLAALFVRVGISLITNANNKYYLATGLWAMAISSILLTTGLWSSSSELIIVTAFSLGWSFGCQQVFWMSLLVHNTNQLSLFFTIELTLSALFGLFHIPEAIPHGLFCGMGLIVSTLISVYFVVRTTQDSASEEPPIETHANSYGAAVRVFAAIFFCVMALQVIAPTLNYLGFLGEIPPKDQLFSITAAKLLSALAVFLICRHMKANYYTTKIFKLLTPVLILLLFAVPFANATYIFIVLIVSSCLHFVVTNSLFCIDTLHLCKRFGLIFELIYSASYLLLMFIYAGLVFLMPRLVNSADSVEMILLFGIFFCVYLLSIGYVALRKRSSASTPTAISGEDEPTEQTAKTPPDPIITASTQASMLKEQNGLSDREAEIVALILRGKNVPAIAKELVVSQNTVRTHVKRIYRACDVHSRQELIAYCESLSVPINDRHA